MKVLIDTNIWIDVALQRQPFLSASAMVLLLAERNQIEGYLSALTISDIYYVVRKGRGREWTIDFLRRSLNFCRVASVDQTVINAALNANFSDFEDAIQYGTALINQLDAIATRNPQDFVSDSIQILNPEALIQQVDAG